MFVKPLRAEPNAEAPAAEAILRPCTENAAPLSVLRTSEDGDCTSDAEDSSVRDAKSTGEGVDSIPVAEVSPRSSNETDKSGACRYDDDDDDENAAEGRDEDAAAAAADNDDDDDDDDGGDDSATDLNDSNLIRLRNSQRIHRFGDTVEGIDDNGDDEDERFDDDDAIRGADFVCLNA